jgi:hypothetical protein
MVFASADLAEVLNYHDQFLLVDWAILPLLALLLNCALAG